MPKRASNTTLKANRAQSWKTGQERKAVRVEEQNARAKANRTAGKAPKQRKRNRDNMRLCNRCHTRTIVAGSVCWCTTMQFPARPAR